MKILENIFSVQSLQERLNVSISFKEKLQNKNKAKKSPKSCFF